MVKKLFDENKITQEIPKMIPPGKKTKETQGNNLQLPQIQMKK